MSIPEPRSTAGAAGLAALLEEPARAVVALDFDGTLAPIVANPERAYAHPGAVDALARLAPRLAAVVVLTGRPAETAVRLGGFAGATGLDRLIVLGHYGLERWDAATGALRAPEEHPGIAALRPELAELPLPEGVRIEDKGHALAVHTRRAAEPDAALAGLEGPLRALAARHGLAVEPGRMVIELRPPGADKGRALTGLAAERHASAVLYCGDDLGDRPAFAAVAQLRAQGIPGVAVCSGSAEVTGLADEADLVVDGPAGVLALLDALAAAFGSAQGG